MQRRSRGFINLFWGVWPVCLFATVLVSPAVAVEPVLLPKPDAFQTLVNPNCSHCIDEAKSRAGDLRADDPVLAWTRGKYDGGAIPIRFFLNPYRVISDTYGVFVFDPDAGFARGYEPSLDFTFYGWRNGIAVMRHKDGTLFSTLSGRAFDGPRKGEQLKPIPTSDDHLGLLEQVLSRIGRLPNVREVPTRSSYRSKTMPIRNRRGVRPIGGYPKTRRFLGVSAAGTWKAYPLNSLPKDGGVIHDTLAGQDIAIFWYPATRTAAAYATRLDGDGATRNRQAGIRCDRANRTIHRS